MEELGEESFNQYWNEGTAMKLDDAIRDLIMNVQV